MEKNKPVIEVIKAGPIIIHDLEKLEYANGKKLETKPRMALCRCGASEFKPYCDHKHTAIGFKGDNELPADKRKIARYKGKNIIIYFDKNICSHSAVCLNNLPQVFDVDRFPWVDPFGAKEEKIIKTIESCPTGALKYTTTDGKECCSIQRDPKVIIQDNGPYDVEGSIELKDEYNSKPFVEEHYSLCRCGKTKNAPFCDGAHNHYYFEDF